MDESDGLVAIMCYISELFLKKKAKARWKLNKNFIY